MVDALFVTLVALVLAYVLSELFKHFGLPRVLGQIMAGIILGIPILKSWFFTPDIKSAFSFITNIGIILLFFFVGLEINFKEFRKNVRESSLIALFNTTIPLFLGFVVSRAVFNLDNITSLVIGISLSVSSQAISLDILEEAKLLKSKIGNIIMTAGTVDDVFELLLVSVILVIFHTVGQGTLKKLIFDILIFVVIIVIFRFSLVPFALRQFEKDKSEATLFMGALIIVLFMAYLSELFSIGSLIGALIAGIIVRQTLFDMGERKPWRKNRISHLIHVMAFGFLIPIFFVNVGLQTSLSRISSNMPLVIVLLVIDIVGTIAGTLAGVRLSKGSVREGLIVGFGVVPKGDTELVIATLALNTGLINIDIFTAIITVALFTTFLGPIAFKMLIRKLPKAADNQHVIGKK